MPNSKFQHAAVWLTALCLLGMLLTGGAMALVTAQRRLEARGLPTGFPAPMSNAGAPPWGVNVALEQYDDASLRRNLDAIQSAGFNWVRQTFAWSQLEPERGQFDWATSDRIVNAVSQSPALQFIAVLDTAPTWARLQPPASNLHPPTDAAHFARFAGEFAKRYGGRIHVYQIWDEPNLGDRWNGEVNPVAYAELLRQAREAILAHDPSAVIVLAGLAPTVENSRANMSDWLYLRRLYEIGAGQYFDVAAGKPYGFSTGPDDRRVDADVLNFSHIVLMREEMERHGDSAKPLWASHAGWNSLPSGWAGQPSVWSQVTRAQQLDFTQRAMQRVALEWPWLGVLVLENWQPATPQDDPRWGFAAADWAGSLALTTAHKRAAYQPAAQPQPFGSKNYSAGAASFLPPEHWSFSELGADWSTSGDKVLIPFYGTGLALHVRRAADRANFYITVDGQPANALPRDERGAFLQLIPPDIQQASVDLIPVATGLPRGPHTAEIVAERGWSQRSLVGWSAQAQPDHLRRYDAMVIALAALAAALSGGSIYFARRATWDALGRIAPTLAARLGNAVQAIAMITAAVALYASMWLTWSAEIPAVFRRVGDGASIAAILGFSALFYYSPWVVVTLLSALILFALILLRLDLGLALVMLVSPFYMLPRAITPYMFSMAEIVLVMCLASWALRLVNQGGDFARRHGAGRLPWRASLARIVGRFSSLDWAALAFVGVALGSLFVAEYAKYALREFRGIVLEPALFYLMLRVQVRQRTTVWRIVDALMLAGLSVAVIGLVQYTFNIDIITAEGGQHRLKSVYGSPNNVGLFLGRVLPVMVAVALLGRGWRRWAYGASAAPVALAILLSFSKGALLLGVPAAWLVIGLLAGGRWLWTAAAALGTVGIAAIPLLQTPRFRSVFDLTRGTSFFRVNVWQSAWQMVREHPVLGVGLDNFLYQYRGRYMLPGAWAEPMLSHPHNFVLDYAARLGLLGLGVGVWLQAAFWRAALPLRKLSAPLQRALAIGLMASMADFLAHGLVDTAYFVVDLAYVFFMTLALVQACGGENPVNTR